MKEIVGQQVFPKRTQSDGIGAPLSFQLFKHTYTQTKTQIDFHPKSTSQKWRQIKKEEKQSSSEIIWIKL